ncbi:hypothetical protein MWU38_06490 [Qipengyuania sp. S6317L1]|uniref:hypothetical protein n=1 Tax=Qipengyuania sp. S6317L1 TaxID=2926410 RepID=UPI001FF1C42C|nr:hypothetical protein [Qipengyuania sp. S6317L1]MCK0099022.1 hypothetical protein [Qipengyuania sp. S6317L1]
MKQEIQSVSAHQIARAEIDSWRGRCMDIYARSERAVSEVLQTAQECGQSVKLSAMAGPRLAEVQGLAERLTQTGKQRQAASNAIIRWRGIEPKRAYLAHGELTTLLDREDRWHARLDLTRFKANRPIEEVWVMAHNEVEAFEEELQESFAQLKQQLGMLRKGLLLT